MLLLVVLTLGPAGLPWLTAAETPPSELAAGVRLAKDGEFEEALLVLDGVARELARNPERTEALTEAYVYLGVVYVGLGQESLARAKFRQALGLDMTLRLSPEEFSRRVLRSFESARRELAERAALEEAIGKKRGKGGLLLLGLGGAAAAGIALVVTTRERPNSPPTASMTITPEGQALVAATLMTFTAQASDPEGEPLTYDWDLGDYARAAGPTVTYRYLCNGLNGCPQGHTFEVTLTVRDGLAATTASGSVTVGNLTGNWIVSGEAWGITHLELRQGGSHPFDGTLYGDDARRLFWPDFYGDTRDPRVVRIDGWDWGGAACRLGFQGAADGSLQTIRGSFTCQQDQHSRGCPCAGQERSATLSRQ